MMGLKRRVPPVRRWLTGAAGAFLLAGAPISASADQWVGPEGPGVNYAGDWFISVGAGAAKVQRPNWRPPFAVYPDNAPEGPAFQQSINQDLFVFGPGATLGYLLPENTLPPWVGTRPRLLLSFGFWTGDDRSNTANGVFDDPNAAIVAQNGIVGQSGTVGGANATVHQSFHDRFQRYELALRFNSDVALSESLVLTPSVGVFGGGNVERMRYRALVQNAGAPTNVFELDQTLKAWRVGGDIGAALTWMVWGGDLRLTVAGRVGAYYISARMSGSDCYSITVTGSCIAPAGSFIPNAFFRTRGRDQESDIGVRATFTASAAYTWGAVTLRILGFFTWESAVPHITNQALDLVNRPAVNTAVGGPRVDYSNGYNAGGYVVISIALPPLFQ